MRPIQAVAEELGIDPSDFIPYGRGKAKIDLSALERRPLAQGKLVLVSAMTPTPAGEGKTTTSIALSMGLRRLGKKAVVALREPSLGPVFGLKGGGTGGGRAQLVPATDINLHFTGDIHAVGAAHNLLAAMVDNELHFDPRGEKRGLDARRIHWRRVLDMNDRALRRIVIGLGGRDGGVPRESGFDITAASEVMAILCLARSRSDLQARLARIVVGRSHDQRPITAEDLGATQAMAALLQDAIMPNLVQTTEGGPALVHGGPFANIAHGCSSVIATELGLRYAEIVVTEAGFGFDLGGEKFIDIKCRKAGLFPSALVLVCTLRALKYHGGLDQKSLDHPNLSALQKGIANLDHHLECARMLGLPSVVAINRFESDTAEEIDWVRRHCKEQGVEAVPCTAFAEGGSGAIEVAEAVLQAIEKAPGHGQAPWQKVYEDHSPLVHKIESIARFFYGANGVDFEGRALEELERLQAEGNGELPICMAKTHLSISDDPSKRGRPQGFRITVREIRLSQGAGFVVALTGEILTMPGLPKEPAARRVRIDASGEIRGLMQGE
ncbi:MAG: formate--tetrahydrofolate ligase [Sandaracinaceae bacterium]|nr:formate--tetrahydrofolate ligase [Sandaracinaceae bacterium]MDW8246451.1 formate--tetrahydrofolate ligase [Sandaracinaceae bacterium]